MSLWRIEFSHPAIYVRAEDALDAERTADFLTPNMLGPDRTFEVGMQSVPEHRQVHDAVEFVDEPVTEGNESGVENASQDV